MEVNPSLQHSLESELLNVKKASRFDQILKGFNHTCTG